MENNLNKVNESILDNFYIDNLIMNALKEDMPFGDVTTGNLLDGSHMTSARLTAKDEGILAGMNIFERTFQLLSNFVKIEKFKSDGESLLNGDLIATIKGDTVSILKGERTALNLLQKLSGIATSTNNLVNEVREYNVKIVDTRKTTPGLRLLEKYAVRIGGGNNHRFSLSDSVMLKDNHIKAVGGISNAVNIIRKNVSHTIKIEVETENLEQVKEAIESRVDIIMLDNMTLDMMKKAVEMINKRAIVEASGNVDIRTVRDIAKTGVDVISVGYITHSVKAFDISLKF